MFCALVECVEISLDIEGKNAIALFKTLIFPRIFFRKVFGMEGTVKLFRSIHVWAKPCSILPKHIRVHGLSEMSKFCHIFARNSNVMVSVVVFWIL